MSKYLSRRVIIEHLGFCVLCDHEHTHPHLPLSSPFPLSATSPHSPSMYASVHSCAYACMCVYVCIRVCLPLCARVCARACVFVFLVTAHACYVLIPLHTGALPLCIRSTISHGSFLHRYPVQGGRESCTRMCSCLREHKLSS